MYLTEDLHTHTQFSHGKGTIEENVRVAIDKGLKRIAISDHGPGHLGFGIKRRDLPVMREEIKRLSEIYPQIEILLAVEANVLGLDGSIDVTEEDRDFYDLILCGYHFGSIPVRFWRDIRIHLYNGLAKKISVFGKQAYKLNTQSVVNAIKRNRIDILTHPGAKGPIDILSVAICAAENGTYLEINNSHGHLTVEEIQIAMKTDVKFYVGSDAHIPSNVGRFENSMERIIKAGLPLERVVNMKEAE